MSNPFVLLMLISSLVFLGTIGHLVINAGSVAALFGKSRREAHAGDMVEDTHGAAKRASPGTIKLSLALHVLGLIGLIVGVLGLMGVIFKDSPAPSELPAEMNPVVAPTAPANPDPIPATPTAAPVEKR